MCREGKDLGELVTGSLGRCRKPYRAMQGGVRGAGYGRCKEETRVAHWGVRKRAMTPPQMGCPGAA